MKFLLPFARGLLTKVYGYNAVSLLKAPYIQTRLMSSEQIKPPTPKPPKKSLEASKIREPKVPQYELEANSYRKIINIKPNDPDAIYGLAVSINRGASIHPLDMRSTRLIGNCSSLDIQAELYRKVLRFNSKHSLAILGLAQCLRKGTPPKIEDLYGTWLEGGNFMLDDEKWGLTKPVILLLAQALEERSKPLEASSAHIENTRNLKKTRPK